jgi:murein tripeptide amidase MpaA
MAPFRSTASAATSLPQISISDAHDGGNGKLLSIDETTNPTTVKIQVQKDPYTKLEQCHHLQYFNFRSLVSVPVKDATDAAPIPIRYSLVNAGDCSYAKAWEESTPFYSTDPNDANSWKRAMDTTYDESTGALTWTYTHTTSGSVYFSYFPPYSYNRHLDLISNCQKSSDASVYSLGQTLDGRDIECIQMGNGPKVAWIIHRQHPGETMAEYYAEGLLERLLGLESGGSVDGSTRRILEAFTIYIVPNMNLDGSVRGHLRTNAQGQNLNREWCDSGTVDKEDYYKAPSLERSPEVYHVLNKMDETGVDFFLDVHGDEVLPYNFLAGGEGLANWGPRLKTLHGAFLNQYNRANSDMQVKIGYEPEDPGQGRMQVCSNQVGYRFDCLAATLEMPFKDCWSNPDPERGWNPARAKMLGASVLEAILYVAPYLRETDLDVVQNAFGTEDEYVRPTSDYKSM